jgi:hypothetical protein
MTPLEHMLRVLNDPTTPQDRKNRIAAAAAPYVHARKAQVEAKTEIATKNIVRVPTVAPTNEAFIALACAAGYGAEIDAGADALPPRSRAN